MTACADSTMLRTHLDDPDAELDAHLDDCEVCNGLLRSVAEDAGYVRTRLDRLAGSDDLAPIDVEAALAAAQAEVEHPVTVLPIPLAVQRPPVGRRLLSSAAVVLVVAGVALTPPGRSAVAATLDAFRGERLQAVSVDLDEWAGAPLYEGMRALDAIGDVDLSGLHEPTEVADAAAAEDLAGLDAPELPGVPDRVVALAPGIVRIVLEEGPGNDVPPALDGATLVVEVPGALGAIFGPSDGPPETVVGRSGSLVIRAEGAPLEEIRDYLLSVEELPGELRRQLADIDDWRSTIPIPVPVDGPGWEELEIDGRDALAFGDDSGFGALVLRHDPDGVTVVGGRMTVSRAVELASEA